MRRTYAIPMAREYAHHGFGRRLGMLIHSIETVFDVLPPDLDEVPDRERVLEATVAIQAFVINAQGCIDNLAWIWVAEKAVKEADGSGIDPKRVGLATKNRGVWRSFSPEFKAYLTGRQDWFDYLKGFRDSLAHRIPLYIPPFIITRARLAEYEQRGVAAIQALAAGDMHTYDVETSAQNALGIFRPWMTHSRTEDAPAVVFHAQLIADYNTVDELGREMLIELDRVPPADAEVQA
jgi:hypothetical protein